MRNHEMRKMLRNLEPLSAEPSGVGLTDELVCAYVEGSLPTRGRELVEEAMLIDARALYQVSRAMLQRDELTAREAVEGFLNSLKTGWQVLQQTAMRPMPATARSFADQPAAPYFMALDERLGIRASAYEDQGKMMLAVASSLSEYDGVLVKAELSRGAGHEPLQFEAELARMDAKTVGVRQALGSFEELIEQVGYEPTLTISMRRS